MEMKFICCDNAGLAKALMRNEEYAKRLNDYFTVVNKAAKRQLSDDELRTFLISPEIVIAKLRTEAEEAFNRFLAKMPDGVRASMNFSFNEDGLQKLGRCKPRANYGMGFIPVVSIKDGRAILADRDKELLKIDYTIYGDKGCLWLFQDLVETVKRLNDLTTAIKKIDRSAKLFNPISEYGPGELIKYFDGRYSINFERLRELFDEVKRKG